MWPNKVADGSLKTKTPGILSDSIDFEQDEITGPIGNNNNNNNTEGDNNGNSQNLIEEFPILDELDRLARVNIFRIYCLPKSNSVVYVINTY